MKRQTLNAVAESYNVKPVPGETSESLQARVFAEVSGSSIPRPQLSFGHRLCQALKSLVKPS